MDGVKDNVQERINAPEYKAIIFELKTLVDSRSAFLPTEVDNRKVGLFQSLRQRDVKIAVCSMAPQQIVSLCLEKLGLRNFACVILSADDITHPKPDPEIYRKAAGALGVDLKECVIVEIASDGAQAAQNAAPGLFVMVDGPEDITEVLF